MRPSARFGSWGVSTFGIRFLQFPLSRPLIGYRHHAVGLQSFDDVLRSMPESIDHEADRLM